MITAGSDRNDIGKSCDLVRPCVIRVAPCDHAAFGSQGEGMEIAAGHRDDVVQSGGHARLAAKIVAPGRDGTVPEQRHVVISSGGDRGAWTEIRWEFESVHSSPFSSPLDH